MEDHELIRRYLAGRLSVEEELVFETRIIRDVQFRKELDLTIALQQGMRELDARGEIDRMLIKAHPSWRRPVIVIAASLGVLAVGVAVVTLTNRDPVPPDPTTKASLQFELTRGAPSGQTVVWRQRGNPTRLQLHLDVGAAPANQFRVALYRQDPRSDAPIAETVTNASDHGEVVWTLDDSLLSPGTFEIHLTPIPDSVNAGSTVYELVVIGR